MRTSFVKSADGTNLRLAHWGDGPRDVLIVHGLAEHAGRYTHVGAALAAAGWTATLVELRGHGHSGGKRGYVDHWSDYRADLQAAAATLRPGWVLLAHSMGALVSLDAIQASAVSPRRVALSCPLLGVSVKLPGWKVAAAKLLSRIIPSLPMKNEIDPNALSRDLEIGKAYMADPLVFQIGTPRWYTEMQAALLRVNGGATPTMPLAVYVGGADHVTDPRASEAYAKRARAALTVYPELRHEIFNEIGKAEIIDTVVCWLGEEAACATG